MPATRDSLSSVLASWYETGQLVQFIRFDRLDGNGNLWGVGGGEEEGRKRKEERGNVCMRT